MKLDTYYQHYILISLRSIRKRDVSCSDRTHTPSSTCHFFMLPVVLSRLLPFSYHILSSIPPFPFAFPPSQPRDHNMTTPSNIRKFAKDAGLKIGDQGLLPEWATKFYEYGNEDGATMEGAIKRIMVCAYLYSTYAHGLFIHSLHVCIACRRSTQARSARRVSHPPRSPSMRLPPTPWAGLPLVAP